MVVEFVEMTDQTTAPRPTTQNKPRKMVSPSQSHVQKRKPVAARQEKKEPLALPSAPQHPPKKKEIPEPVSQAVVEKKKEISVAAKPPAKTSKKKQPTQARDEGAFRDVMDDIEAFREQIIEEDVPTEKQEKSLQEEEKKEKTNTSRAQLSDRPTASEIDALRSQIEQYWVVDPGMKGAGEMTISLRIRLERDGSVTRIEIMEKDRYNQDPTYRAMVESARRAVYRAQPLEYPAAKYDVLKTVVLVFRPPLLQSSF